MQPHSTCSVSDCTNRHLARGWCKKHYHRWYRHGDPLFVLTPSTCSIPDCDGRYEARGWCTKHYQRWQHHGNPLITLTPGLIIGTEAERFRPKVELQPDGCKIWTAALNPGGYGVFGVGGKTVYAHRWAYEHEVGPIPDGLTLDHLCRNRACVEVTHLEPVTRGKNVLRGVGLAAQNARKTHCLRGHEFTPENTYTRLGGKRQCRQCRRARDAARVR